MHGRTLAAVALGLTMAAAVACGGGNSGASSTSAPAEPKASGSSAAAPNVDPATAGEIKGLVVLDGTAPKNEVLKMTGDPVCMRESKGPQYAETYIVGEDGKSLANVFVYVKDGLNGVKFDTPAESVKIDQKDCRYIPHVVGVRVGQPIEITNSDPTLHNIHAMSKVNQEFNNGQPIQGMKMSHTFTQKEVMIPFKCDVHGWMNAYVGVVDNPYYATTEKDGTFDLKNLPPGTYTLEAWHEKLGPQTQTVTIGAKETKEVTFSFKPAAGAAPSN